MQCLSSRSLESFFAEILSESHIEKLFLFSVMWSLGAALELDGRLLFQEYVVNHESKCNWPEYLVRVAMSCCIHCAEMLQYSHVLKTCSVY